LNKGKPLVNASGSGHFANAPGEQRVFSHNARMNADGSVSGHFDVNNKSQGLHVSGIIFCLNVIGNAAFFGAVITNTNAAPTDPFWQEGHFVLWSTMDNGEGGNSPTDQITLVTTNPAWTQAGIEGWCAAPFIFSPYLEIERGNIQIR
jgi:hypothetical protein